jgi:hypothetical protein
VWGWFYFVLCDGHDCAWNHTAPTKRISTRLSNN